MTPAADITTPWRTLREGASYAKTGQRIVRQAVLSGALRSVRVGGRREVRVKVEWLDRWLEGLGSEARK